MKSIFTILFIGITQLSFAQSSTFTKVEIEEDLVFLKQALIKNHPNLYTYSTKKEVDDFFENLISSLPNEMNETETYNIIASVSQIVKDGHSYVYPTKKHLEMFYNSGLLFPLDVFWNNGELYVLQDLTIKQNFPIGSKIQSINGISVEEIHQTITQNSSRDGDNLAYPNFVFYEFFPAYYSFFYGFQNEFTIDFLTENGSPETVKTSGLSRNKRQERTKMYFPESLNGSLTNHGILASNYVLEDFIVLQIQSFDNKILKEDYQIKLKKEVKNAFQLLEKQKTKNLVIDLRGNQGGELSNGVYLLRHFMSEPFQCVKSYHKVSKDENYHLTKVNNKWDNVFKPNKNAFDGNVFLLVDGGSYSCSAIVANTFQQYNRGKIIGSMTGGSAFVNSGGPNELVELPNSKVQFTIPKTQYVLQDLNDVKQGVIPDYEVHTTMKAILENRDLHLEKVKELINH